MRKIATAVRTLIKIRTLMMSCFFFLVSAVLWAQEKTITGVVKNAGDGTPLVRATVQVKGTNKFATTDEKGHYSIKAVNSQTLVVTAVGFKASEKGVGTQSVLNFNLENASTEMENVVVTALGIRREEKALGYSTTTVKGEQLTDAVAGNWTDALSGKEDSRQ